MPHLRTVLAVALALLLSLDPSASRADDTPETHPFAVSAEWIQASEDGNTRIRFEGFPTLVQFSLSGHSRGEGGAPGEISIGPGPWAHMGTCTQDPEEVDAGQIRIKLECSGSKSDTLPPSLQGKELPAMIRDRYAGHPPFELLYVVDLEAGHTLVLTYPDVLSPPGWYTGDVDE